MANGLLVRVAIDSTSGGWVGPCNNSGGFCYVPMGDSSTLTTAYNTSYKPYEIAVNEFLPINAHPATRWPSQLPSAGHFDPDFYNLSFGDANRRGARIHNNLDIGDFIVFYAGLRSIHTGKLCYSIIGFYEIEQLLFAKNVPINEWHRNEHTRPKGCLNPDPNEIVVFAKPGKSGRLLSHIPIGSYFNRAYRIQPEILEEWGGLDVKGGYIQRSIFLPAFLNGDRFLQWFQRQNPQFIQFNNP